MLSVLSVAKPRGVTEPSRVRVPLRWFNHPLVLAATRTHPRLRDWTWEAEAWRQRWFGVPEVEARANDGAWHRLRVDNRWVFRVTRELIDDCGVLEVRGYVAVYDDYGTDCRVYARRGIAWTVRAERAWSRRRYCVERALVRRGVLLCEEGCYLSAWRFNWDWRWYDEASWGRRAAAWRSAQTLR